MKTRAKFALGHVLITLDAWRALNAARRDVEEFLTRHASGDWGERSRDMEWDANDRALKYGTELYSCYELDREDQTNMLCVVTDGYRERTVVMMWKEDAGAFERREF